MRSNKRHRIQSLCSRSGLHKVSVDCGIGYSATGTLLKTSKPASSRPGLTLYEVVISLTLFLGAMLAISQIISTGSRAAVQSRLRTQAILRCESKLSEILAGYEPMESVSSAQVDEDANWIWSLEINPGPHETLLDLTISVSHLSQEGHPDSTFSLRRFVRDPQLFLDAAEAAAEAEAEAEAAAEGGG